MNALELYRTMRRIVLATLISLHAIPQQLQVPTTPSFDVVSIHQSQADGWYLRFTADSFVAKGVSLQYLLQEAFGVYNDQLWTNVPSWTDNRKFDVQARFKSVDDLEPTREDQRVMLQSMLEDRFKLVVHRETAVLPAYALVVVKGGPKLHQTTKTASSKDDECSHTQEKHGYSEQHGCSMKELAVSLTSYADVKRTVIDRTELDGKYDFALRWQSDLPRDLENSDLKSPNIFEALKEQLGLQLKPCRAPLQVIAVDHIEMPSDN
jgi:uncharacterized protein (TIGR03435 family)